MLKCSILFIMKEIIILMTACKLVIGNYKGLYNANIWMSTALWGISGNAFVEGTFLQSIGVLVVAPSRRIYIQSSISFLQHYLLVVTKFTRSPMRLHCF